MKLTADNLSFSYPFRPIIKGLNFEIKGGELLHLQGPNGIGKSTLLKLISGQIPLESGALNWEGSGTPFSMEYLPAEANGLFLQLDAISNLQFYQKLRNHSFDEQHAIEVLIRWGIDSRVIKMRLPVSKFSTGMRRKMALARLELSKAPFWLLDEPLYGLDEEGVRFFVSLLKQHINKGNLAIVVSHDKKSIEDVVNKTLQLKPSSEWG